MPKYTTPYEFRGLSGVTDIDKVDTTVNYLIDEVTGVIDNETGRTWQRVQTAASSTYDGDGTDILWLDNTDIQVIKGLWIDDDEDGVFTLVHAEDKIETSPSAGSTTINVYDTSTFDDSGTLIIDSEQITYTGKTSTSFTGCTRGANSTTATSHSKNAKVYNYPNNVHLYPEGYIILDSQSSINKFTPGTKLVKVTYNHGAIHETNLDGELGNTSTTIIVDESTDFPNDGVIKIDDEWIKYTYKPSSTAIGGCTRAYYGTTAATHLDGTVVYEGASPYVRRLANKMLLNEIHEEVNRSEEIIDMLQHIMWKGPKGLS
ncbi:MAG: hypothetical protein ACTSXD_08560 [Candidatus Heimdallarchaeaceae archaeon]